MKRILVPCDFSAQAKNAFKTATSVGDSENCEIHLLHVIEIPVFQDPLLMPIPLNEEGIFFEMEKRAKEQFDQLIAGTETALSTITQIAFGNPTIMIRDYITENKIDLVIMGTRGGTGIREALIGSTTDKIVRQSSVPVLVVRNAIEKKQITDIVFPNALEMENQEKLIERVKELQEFFHATLHIVWVNTPGHFIADNQTRKRLEAFVNRYMFKNYTLNIYNDIYEESGIINFAHEKKANLLAMGTHGRKGIAHMFAGSVTEDVVNHIDLPIWTFAFRSESKHIKN